MSKKTFTGTPKPGKQPTLEEIDSFEESGCATSPDASRMRFTETQAVVFTDNRDRVNPEMRESVKPETQKHRNLQLWECDVDESLECEAGETERLVRLTIDLPETAHTRFKAACAASRRKMVQEVRSFIERRTVQLEADAKGEHPIQ